ncbi:hypothetical protein DQG23_04910 [Paenibacillus contaminans]|uniref:Uncharacterized protein n=1 Tax=Paenibacillus contaminans TaxID=450362 RepID=A0A329MR88_9BACL|nr:hypothetical protein DQG23_04910 [Paenibacillus contaminans]
MKHIKSYILKKGSSGSGRSFFAAHMAKRTAKHHSLEPHAVRKLAFELRSAKRYREGEASQ